MDPTIDEIGNITKVDQHYVFVRTEKGDVHVGVHAALRKAEPDRDLRNHFTHGECVHVKAKTQPNKNRCVYSATWMRSLVQPHQDDSYITQVSTSTSTGLNVSRSSRISETQFHDDYGTNQIIMASVVEVYDSHLFARHDKLGSIFVPGSAFKASECTSLCMHIFSEDYIAVSVTRQEPKNSCHWLGVSATKDMTGVKYYPTFPGVGTVTQITRDYCRVRCEEHEIDIHCPILTYTGGTRGLEGVNTLEDVIMPGEIVQFSAKIQDDGIRRNKEEFVIAEKWYPMSCRVASVRNDIPLCGTTFHADSETQTTITPENMLLRALLKDHPEVFTGKEHLVSLISPKNFEKGEDDLTDVEVLTMQLNAFYEK